MIGMSPKDTTELNEVPLVGNYPPEDTLPVNGLYRYFLQASGEHDDQHKKATDRIWSKGTCKLSEVMSSPGNRVIYHLADGPKRAFVKGELMLIPEDTELPPDFVQKW